MTSANGEISNKVTAGKTISHTNEKDTTVSTSFGTSLEAGFEFAGVSSKFAATASLSKEIK